MKKFTKNLSDEQKMNSNTRVYCIGCNKTFSSKSSLSNHKKRCKGKEPMEQLIEKEQLVVNNDIDIEEIIKKLTQKGYYINNSNNSEHVHPICIPYASSINKKFLTGSGFPKLTTSLFLSISVINASTTK